MLQLDMKIYFERIAFVKLQNHPDRGHDNYCFGSLKLSSIDMGRRISEGAFGSFVQPYARCPKCRELVGGMEVKRKRLRVNLDG